MSLENQEKQESAETPIEQPSGEIMAPPEIVPAPITLPIDRGNGNPEPSPVPAFGPPWICAECGKADLKNEQALRAHIRFKHDLPKARKLAAERKANGSLGTPEPSPDPAPPDFTDINGAAPLPTPGAQPNLVLPAKRFEEMAKMSFEMGTGILARLLGPEWQSTDPDERATVILAIQKYYQSVDLPDIPPGYMLCFVIAAYAAPRMGAQPTRTKLQGAWLWLKTKFGRKRNNIPVMRIVQQAQPEAKP